MADRIGITEWAEAFRGLAERLETAERNEEVIEVAEEAHRLGGEITSIYRVPAGWVGNTPPSRERPDLEGR